MFDLDQTKTEGDCTPPAAIDLLMVKKQAIGEITSGC
jgi:hypothetical protein